MYFKFRNVVLYIKKTMKLLSIIIPVYNEDNTIHLILNKIKNIDLPLSISKEIIIIMIVQLMKLMK